MIFLANENVDLKEVNRDKKGERERRCRGHSTWGEGAEWVEALGSRNMDEGGVSDAKFIENTGLWSRRPKKKWEANKILFIIFQVNELLHNQTRTITRQMHITVGSVSFFLALYMLWLSVSCFSHWENEWAEKNKDRQEILFQRLTVFLGNLRDWNRPLPAA